MVSSDWLLLKLCPPTYLAHYFFFFDLRGFRLFAAGLLPLARVASNFALRRQSAPTREHISRPVSPTITPDTQNESIGFSVYTGYDPLLSHCSVTSPSVPTIGKVG